MSRAQVPSAGQVEAGQRRRATACTCHKSPHGGQLFDTKKCNRVSLAGRTTTLSGGRFDHKKDAGYALQGDHAQLKCDACHTERMGKRKPSGACETCHADDNHHGDRFKAFGNPPCCTTCHCQRAWKTTMVFDHAAKAAWKLTGKHAITGDCRTCHRGTKPAQFEGFQIANGCMSCHQHKQAHGGKYANNECRDLPRRARQSSSSCATRGSSGFTGPRRGSR